MIPKDAVVVLAEAWVESGLPIEEYVELMKKATALANLVIGEE